MIFQELEHALSAIEEGRTQEAGEFLKRLIDVALKTGQWDTASSLIMQSVSRKVAQEGIGILFSFVLTRLYRFDLAHTLLQQTARHFPNDLQAIYRLAVVEVVFNRPAAAIPLLRQVLQTDQTHLGALYCLGGVMLALGQEEKGLRQYQRMLALDPGNEDAGGELRRHEGTRRAAAKDRGHSLPVVSGRKNIDVITVVFGEDFCRMSGDVMARSLYDHNPELLEGRKVRHNIYTLKDHADMVAERFAWLEERGVELRIDTDLLAQAGEQRLRAQLYKPYAEQFLRSMSDGRLVVFAPPDHVFGFGLDRVVTALKPGGYLVCGHPRMDMHAVEDLRQALRENPFQGNHELVRLAMEVHAHPVVRFGLRYQNPYWRAAPCPDGYSVNFKEPPPLACDPTPGLIEIMSEDSFVGAYETLDHDLVEYCFAHGRLQTVDDSADFFWTELTSSDMYAPTLINQYCTRSSTYLMNRPVILRTAAPGYHGS